MAITQQEYQKVNNAINKEYTSDSVKNYTDAYNKYVSQWMGTQDAFNKASSLLVKNQPATPTPTKTTPAPAQTTPTPTTPETPTPTTPTPTRQTWVDVSGIKNMWDNLSYDDQQKYLGQYKGLQESLTAKGITNKAKPEEAAQTTPTTPTKTTTPTGKDEWDYQDASEWRIYEIAWHLNDYRVSQPNLFNDWATFSNFFIDWKDRSQEQLNYLRDYFNAVKRYNSLDNMTADTVGNMMVNGTIPDDYLNYVKYSNPQRYSEIMDAKARATDRIKDSASMDTVKSMEWATDTTTSKSIEWLKNQWLLLDKDWNLIDDRTEVYASEEENKYLKSLADLAARNLDIDNTVKHTYDDYVERYPWATKATLMAMAQDVNSDLLREKENNLVEMTRFQGYVDYMQKEREDRMDIGQNAIDQLQKQYWMYYQYSPEWMSELAAAQYAATNITLDQADNWTDAQKQLALKNVLDWYYSKFWDIIERSEEQVIWDVIRLAKERGITLNEALKEDFINPLKKKPNYMKYASWWDNWYWEWKVIWKDALWADVYWFVNTSTWVVVPYGNVSGWTWTWYWTWYWAGWYDANWVYQFSDAEVREAGSDWKYKDTIWNDINSIWHILASNDWIRVWTYQSPNWYTYNVYANREDWIKATEQLLRNSYYWMTLWDAAQKWIGKGKDITAAKNVIRNAWLKLSDKLSDSNARAFIEAMGTWEWTLKWKSLDDWAKWGKDLSWYGNWWTSSFDNSMSKAYDEYAEAKSSKEKAAVAARYWKTTEQMDKEAYQYDWWRNAEDVKSLVDEIDKMLDWEIEIPSARQRMDTADTWELDPITSFFIPWSSKQSNRNWLYSHNLIHDTLWMKKLIELKSRGATFWALSDPEREAINNVATKLAPWMDDATYKQTLRDIRSALVKSAHWYLDNYHYQWWTMSDAAAELWLTK